MLSPFLRGQLSVMAILAVLYSVAYALLGVRLAVPAAAVANIFGAPTGRCSATRHRSPALTGTRPASPAPP
jgi:hypothetical protein